MSARTLFSLAALALLLSGCAAQNLPARAPDVFSVLYNERAAQPFQADWLILDEYRKQQNVALDVKTGDDADYGKALIQALEAEEIADIILKAWPDQIETYAASDAAALQRLRADHAKFHGLHQAAWSAR